MSEHEEAAARAERELADMQRRSDELESEIEHVKADWDSKQHDPTVPTAPDQEAQDEEVPPEANFTTRGGEEN